MLRTIAYSQLDPATKAYLRAVRQARGRGAPGVFEGGSSGYAGVSLLIGAVVLTTFLWCGYSTNKAAWAMALLQTAGVMLGGWLILYAFRRWFAGTDGYAGKFVYFDPEHVFVGEGEELKYARLDDETAVEPAGDNALKIETGSGTFAVPVPSRTVALIVADYYDALTHLRKEENGWWRGVSPAELGAMARYMVVNERVPTALNDVVLDIDQMPDEVRPARGRPSGVLRYLIILAVGGLVFTGFWLTNKPVHDAGAFAAVNQTSPAELRHYLGDPNTFAHHDEAKAKLKELYAAKRKELAARANTDPAVRDAFLELFGTLDGPEPPAVSIAATDTTGNAGNTLRTRLADGIGTEAGKDFILFVQKPDDPGRWPLMEVTYGNDPTNRLTWALAFRRLPTDEKPYATLTGTITDVSALPSEAVYADVMKKMFGNAPAAPAQLPLDDW